MPSEAAPSRATMRSPSVKVPRERALDVLRGIGIVLMVICDEARTVFGCRIAHAPWHGIAPADLVFPLFLFATGYAVSLAPVSTLAPFLSRVFRLMLLGIVLQPPRARNSVWLHLPTIRLPGILQRIAVASLVPRLVLQFLVPRNQRFRGSRWRTVALSVTALVLASLYLVATYTLHSCPFDVVGPLARDDDPNATFDVYHPSCNAAREIDRLVLSERHIYWYPTYRRSKACSPHAPCASTSDISYDNTILSRAWDKLFISMRPTYCDEPFDPEGLLSTLNASVAALIGAIFAESLSSRVNLLFSFISAVVGWYTTAFLAIPVNKPLYTTSFLLISSGFAGVAFTLARCDIKFLRIFERFGRYSLRMFLLGGLALPERFMKSVIISREGLTLFDLVMRMCREFALGRADYAELVYAAVKLALLAAIAGYWDRRRVIAGTALRTDSAVSPNQRSQTTPELRAYNRT